MQTSNRRAEYTLENFIKDNYKELSFIELIRLLKTESKIEKNFNQLFESLEIQPHLSLAFPSSDIESLKKIDGQYFVETNFLSLYGSSSPLPTFYTEDLIEEQLDGETLLKDFYNIFNQHKYQQYFNAHLKYRLSNRIVENKESDILNILYSFIGKNHIEEIEELQYFTKIELLRYAQLFLHTTRSKDGLKILINGLLNIRIDIVEFIKTYEEIPKYQLCSIGKDNCELGENVYLGDKLLDMSSTFKVILYDLNKESFNYFQKEQLGYKKIEELIRFYVGSSYKWILEYELHDDYKVTRLGDTFWGTLGVNSWLNSKKDKM